MSTGIYTLSNQKKNKAHTRNDTQTYKIDIIELILIKTQENAKRKSLSLNCPMLECMNWVSADLHVLGKKRCRWPTPLI